MKKWMSALLVSAVLLSGTNSAAADQPIQVVIDGQKQTFDQPPVLINGRTMVPMRAIFEKLGVSVVWDDAAQSVTATRKSMKVTLQIGNKIAKRGVSGKEVTLDQEPVIVGGRTMVPVRFVSESFQADVGWDAASNTVLIAKYPELTEAVDYNDLATVKALLEKQVDLNVKNWHGATALAQASFKPETLDAFKLLLAAGADFNTVDEDGDSPLAYATGYGNIEVVKLLLATGNCALNTRNKDGLTPLGLAKRYKQTEIANLLAGSGATE